MKLIDRQLVEGTEPRIYIGRREYHRPDGSRFASRKYYADWCVDARHAHKALGTSNKAAAIRAAHDICRRMQEGLGAPKTYRLTIQELKDQYLEVKRNEGLAPKTIQKYEWGLGHFAGWCEQTHRRSAAKFGEQDFWAYSRAMTEQKLTPKVRYDRLILIKQAFKFAKRLKLIPEYPFDGIRLKKPDWGEQPCFSPQQIAALLAAAKGQDAAIYAVMAYAGLRFGEVRDLRWSDIHWEEGKCGVIVVKRGGSRLDATKNQKTRRIPLNADLKPYLALVPRRFERVFTARPSKKHPDGGGPVDERRLLMSLKRLCKRIRFENAKSYKLHTFRHTFASMCARNSVAYRYALEWMGHSSSRILDLYYRSYDDVAAAAMKTIAYPAPVPSKAESAA